MNFAFLKLQGEANNVLYYSAHHDTFHNAELHVYL